MQCAAYATFCILKIGDAWDGHIVAQGRRETKQVENDWARLWHVQYSLEVSEESRARRDISRLSSGGKSKYMCSRISKKILLLAILWFCGYRPVKMTRLRILKYSDQHLILLFRILTWFVAWLMWKVLVGCGLLKRWMEEGRILRMDNGLETNSELYIVTYGCGSGSRFSALIL